MQNEKVLLPIDSSLDKILEGVRDYSTIIVKASPGSGKTTRLPWTIASKLQKKVAVLEPRRLAAKLAALRIADEAGLMPGKEVGYHFRFERKVSQETRLIFYTEGTFLKMFFLEKELSSFDVVILDEFHERHLETDLAFALMRSLQTKRKDLKLVIMSATLNEELLSSLPDSVFINVEGVVFPVKIDYLPNQPSVLGLPLESKVKNAIQETEGDTLVFLPGMREMLKVKDILPQSLDILLLHADLSRQEQALALLPSKKRKIILATNIAESSVTIPGIRTVIDSGIQRESIFSPWTGLKTLQDKKITQSSAIQRAGRAGRTGPGVCRRLYAHQDFLERAPDTIPEIGRADLTDVCLLVRGANLSPLWLQPPALEKWKLSTELLIRLGALTENYTLTAIGRKMMDYPLQARLARVLIEGESLQSELRKKLLHFITMDIEKDNSGNLFKRMNHYLEGSGYKNKDWEKCLLAGFMDQVGKYRPKGRDFIHYCGKVLKAHQSLEGLQEGYYIIFDMTQREEAINVLEICEEWLWDLEPFPFSEEISIDVDGKINLKTKTKLGSIPVEESQIRSRWSSLKHDLKERIKRECQVPIQREISNWKDSSEGKRLIFWAKLEKKNLDDILSNLDPGPYFEQSHELNFDHFFSYIHQLIDEKLTPGNLNLILPDKINLGGRRELTIHYSDDQGAYIEAAIQEFYGICETPSLMDGKIPLTLKLLGPHKRPIQITRDLHSFWQNTYQEMRKVYSRDYPRHYWPDKPWEAKPFLLKSHLPKA